jgi:hypothetical protein
MSLDLSVSVVRWVFGRACSQWLNLPRCINRNLFVLQFDDLLRRRISRGTKRRGQNNRRPEKYDCRVCSHGKFAERQRSAMPGTRQRLETRRDSGIGSSGWFGPFVGNFIGGRRMRPSATQGLWPMRHTSKLSASGGGTDSDTNDEPCWRAPLARRST